MNVQKCSKNMSEEDVCRLCGNETGIHINIFESTPECLAKIEAVVPEIVILRYDSLSKQVCHRCVAKVKDFHEFKENCIKTQRNLKEKLPWIASSLKNTKRPISPVVTYLGGPLAYPFGDPEPEVEVLTLSDDEDSVGTSRSLHSSQPKGPVLSSAPNSVIVPNSPPAKKVRKNENGLVNHLATNQYGPPIPRGIGHPVPRLPVPQQLQAAQSSFNSFLEYQYQISNPPGQKASARGRGRGRLTLPFSRRKPQSSTSTVTSSTDEPPNSALQEVSTNIENSVHCSSVFQPVPPAVPISDSKVVPELHNNLPTPSPFVSKPVRSGTAVDTQPKHVKVDEKLISQKPMPRCKKKPQFQMVKICSDTVIWTCMGCNTILTMESCLEKHQCLAQGSSPVNCEPERNDENQSVQVQNEESNHSTSSVELISSDDEVSNCKADPKHGCKTCGKQFLNLARLQKHEYSHAPCDAFG